MKPSKYILWSSVILALVADTSSAQNSSYAVTERGADYCVLSKTVQENGTNCVRQYTQLATGLNYTNSYGQLVESKEQISILPTGGAAAVQGQHQVYFPADIYDGVLEVVTPDGRHLRSRPLGVSYDDGSNTVFIATLTNSTGVLTASNQVTYPNAFTDFKADLVCTYRRGGFECDLVFRQQPPAPDQYSLDDASSTLQLVTEFFNTADPQEIPGAYDEWYGLRDDTLKFGRLTMKQGKAFAIKSTNSQPAALDSQLVSAPVYKRWLHLDGRKFLIEEVPLEYLADDLSTLPEATNALASKATGNLRMASHHRQMPVAHELVSDTSKIQIASTDFSQQPGVVLDYNTVDTSQPDFTFQSDKTYFISDYCYFAGAITLEGGTVLKFANHTILCNNVICQTGPYSPAILTSQNDNSVGQTIDGSNGNPVPAPETAEYLEINSETNLLKHLRVSYAGMGIVYASGEPLVVSDSEFIYCSRCALLLYGFGEPAMLNNVLFGHCGSVIFTPDLAGNLVYGSQLTMDNLTYGFCYGSTHADGGYLAYITNSLATDCYSMTVNDFDGWEHFEFPLSTRTSIYTSAASRHYFLAANSIYRDVGTTDIDPDLLAELPTLTTYAPQDGGNPDNDGQPDLGYHYPVSLCSVNSGNSLWVNANPTPLEMARWLMGTNPVTVSNAKYTGAAAARGIFGNGYAVGWPVSAPGLPIDTGIILSSGDINNAIGKNDSSSKTTQFNNSIDYNGDPDLDKLVGGSGTEDAAVLEFDIVSATSFTLQFQYIFASEEYPEWIGQFNDPMAIFVSANRVGTNWINSISNDIALVPGTPNLSVSVNTINGGGNGYGKSQVYEVPPSNPQCYVDNADPYCSTNQTPLFNIQYDGFTVPLTAQKYITAGVTNHVKIAIADYKDSSWDSAVFVKASIPCQ